MGGSAWSMTRDISDGFVNVTERIFRQMNAGQMNKLGQEIDRLLRELRGSAIANEPSTEVQNRQRRIQRLNTAMTILRAHRLKTKR